MKKAGMEPIMITGDNERTAKAIAKKAGIDEVIAGVLPEEKAEHIRALQKKGFRVAMVGDGINDAPGLMQADVGIAFAAGTDISIESADIIITGNRLGAIMDAYHIAKNSYRKTKQNLALAFSFNGLGVPLSITGLVHPIWAMIAMAASVSVVLLNSFGGRLIPPVRRRRVAKKITTSDELEILVPTIHCEGCIDTIKNAISEIKGVEHVKGNLFKKTVRVQIKGNGSQIREKIIEKITGLGHRIGDSR
jgi:cation transport ATPase